MVHFKGQNIKQARQKLCMDNVELLTEVRHEKSVVVGCRDRLHGRIQRHCLMKVKKVKGNMKDFFRKS